MKQLTKPELLENFSSILLTKATKIEAFFYNVGDVNQEV